MRPSFKLIAASIAGLGVYTAAQASELKFGFQNPGFGGNPLASNYYLGMLENQKLVKEKKEDKLSSSQDLVGTFAEGLKSRILSAIASKITQDIFGSDSVQGTFSIDNMLLDYQLVGDKVVINLTDGITNTTIEVPRFEVDKAAGS
ncbi:curli assembly protein CsgF [Rhizobium sp. YJ-22]|uniref:curli assembly protein CsgF n=1 Tax=Rhizobium sp. YJ-22 TaxID=3037556 RepID=UPI002412A055|nr:curli assembly protein CsgF [Rhizobium sp. YJ-22]MDG3580198.1 curli assembly protein CsgF [Rhizobium sp. YJ-22]